jgi:hypothetical protein
MEVIIMAKEETKDHGKTDKTKKLSKKKLGGIVTVAVALIVAVGYAIFNR